MARKAHENDTTASPASGSVLADASKERTTLVPRGAGGSATAVDGGAFASHAFETHRAAAGHSSDVVQLTTDGALAEHASAATPQTQTTEATVALRNGPDIDTTSCTRNSTDGTRESAGV
jgi:hypothetical protein